MLVCRMSEDQAPRRSSRVASKRVADAGPTRDAASAAVTSRIAAALPAKRGKRAHVVASAGMCVGYVFMREVMRA